MFHHPIVLDRDPFIWNKIYNFEFSWYFNVELYYTIPNVNSAYPLMTLYYFAFQSFHFERHLMKVFPETRGVH
jgi:hypothetical protein